MKEIKKYLDDNHKEHDTELEAYKADAQYWKKLYEEIGNLFHNHQSGQSHKYTDN